MNTQVEQLQVFRGTVRNAYRAPNSLFTFRLEELDDTGDIIGYKVVECYNINTDLAINGDEVEVIGRVKQDGAVLAKKITNLVTGKTVEVSTWLYDFNLKASNDPELVTKIFASFFLFNFLFPLIFLMFTGIIGGLYLINSVNPKSQPKNNGRQSSGLRIETVTLKNCSIKNTRPFPKDIRNEPNPFGGYVSGKVEAHSTYTAIQRADRISNSGRTFDTWFRVKNNGQEGWISSNTPGISAVGNCDR
ncbi:MAG: hypothetical protein F6K63_27370 [Moorea sp. SIO1G6]|uniref:hypothetical protein n=1 Tax=Moorena sp. SIO1G6 TaxID=2607840 RepID=UPI0013C011E6|nr:hypothetical protein [Moorena sp. SIO1G6]NET67905.1 hypothetical protein [Moorena sp. SIO1G6]